MRNILLVALVGCSSQSPLVESSPQVELATNPGAVPDHPVFELSLTTWNHLAALGDATTSGQLEATLDGQPLVLDPVTTGYADNGDSYTAAFLLQADKVSVYASGGPATSSVMVTDQVTTWSVVIANLFANDLHPVGLLMANQPNALEWPSAMTGGPVTSIEYACIDVAGHTAACQSDEQSDPGITIAQQYVHVDVPAETGDHFSVWAQRSLFPQASGDGPAFETRIFDRIDGTFE
jgi:hypothetical protein